MASRNIEELKPEMREKVQRVLRECEQRGIKMLVYCTFRSYEEQAKLYRQGRPLQKILDKADQLTAAGFGQSAFALIDAGAQTETKIVTNAAPGESYHNHGLAIDAVPMINGACAWSYEDNERAWNVYGAACRSVGLEWGGDWNFKDYPHAQLGSGNPLTNKK